MTPSGTSSHEGQSSGSPSGARRFPLRYGVLKPLLTALGLGPGRSGVLVTPDAVEVTMGWAFSTRLPRPAVRRAEVKRGRVLSIGVHGWRGRWLVNGASTGVVAVELAADQRASALGLSVPLRSLLVGVEDPEGLADELGRS